MSKTKPKRTKKHRPMPKAALFAGGLMALQRIQDRAIASQPMHEAQITDILSFALLGLTNMTQGAGTRESWGAVVTSLNIGLVLAETVFDRQHEQDFVAALDGAAMVEARSRKAGVYRFDGPALQAVQFAMSVHEEQLKLATKAEIRQAMLIVHERMKAGNVYRMEASTSE